MKSIRIAIVLSALTLVAFHAPQTRAEVIDGDRWAAIAFSPSTGSIGYGWNQPVYSSAAQSALDGCGSSDAKIVQWVKLGWAVIAVAEDYAYGTASTFGDGAAWKPAYEGALQALRKVSDKKVTRVVVVCSGNIQPKVFLPADEARKTYKVGQEVRAWWRGQWYDARVLEAADGQYKITYVGSGSEWDEWVGNDRLAARPGVATYQVGQEVRTKWGGEWYDARILEVADGRYKVTYNGFGSEWDEWVDADRIAVR